MYFEEDMQATWDNKVAFLKDQESRPFSKETPACD